LKPKATNQKSPASSKPKVRRQALNVSHGPTSNKAVQDLLGDIFRKDTTQSTTITSPSLSFLRRTVQDERCLDDTSEEGNGSKVLPSSALASTGQGFCPARSTSPVHKKTVPLLISWSCKHRSVIRRPTHAANTTASIACRQPLQMEGHTHCMSM